MFISYFFPQECNLFQLLDLFLFLGFLWWFYLSKRPFLFHVKGRVSIKFRPIPPFLHTWTLLVSIPWLSSIPYKMANFDFNILLIGDLFLGHNFSERFWCKITPDIWRNKPWLILHFLSLTILRCLLSVSLLCGNWTSFLILVAENFPFWSVQAILAMIAVTLGVTKGSHAWWGLYAMQDQTVYFKCRIL